MDDVGRLDRGNGLPCTAAHVDRVDAGVADDEGDLRAVRRVRRLELLLGGVDDGRDVAARDIELVDAIAAGGVAAEQDPSAVGRPSWFAMVVRPLGQLTQSAAVAAYRPEVEHTVAVRLEDQLASVRRPLRLRDVVEVAGQPARRTSRTRYHPQHPEQVERDVRTVRRHARRQVRSLAGGEIAALLPWPGDGIRPGRCCGDRRCCPRSGEQGAARDGRAVRSTDSVVIKMGVVHVDSSYVVPRHPMRAPGCPIPRATQTTTWNAANGRD